MKRLSSSEEEACADCAADGNHLDLSCCELTGELVGYDRMVVIESVCWSRGTIFEVFFSIIDHVDIFRARVTRGHDGDECLALRKVRREENPASITVERIKREMSRSKQY